MMKQLTLGVFFCLTCLGTARADVLVGTNGRLTDGKIVSVNDKEIVIQPDGGDAQPPLHVARGDVTRIIHADEHGAAVAAPAAPQSAKPPVKVAPAWDIPEEPKAPPMVTARTPGPTYYIIPLHGEVGATVLASALEKSLADAVLRKPTVIILDIDSPGGMVSEALKIIKVIGHYNRKARIIAFTDQDLSAAAIFSLSVKKIYVKPTSTIGAATSFIPGQPDLSAKVEEKMQSAWRAAARNGAEEGGHEPLLADAMIDNTVELHLEKDGGQMAVREGPGEKVLCRKGKILTLTSHEAITCGLAAGAAEDLAELGELLGYPKWTECQGLATPLAAYLPKRDEAFKAYVKKIEADFKLNIEAARRADPTEETSTVEVLRRPIGPRSIRPIPGRPYIPGRQNGAIVEQRTVRRIHTGDWKQRSLACVVALQEAEVNLRDAIALSAAFGHDEEAVSNILTQISALRAKIYDDRNKYGPGSPGASGQLAGAPPAESPAAQGMKANPGVKAPAPVDSETKLKAIEAGWRPHKTATVDLLATLNGMRTARNDDGSVLISRGGRLSSPGAFRPGVSFRIVAMTDEKDLRLHYGASQIILNWEMDHAALRVDGGPAAGQHKPGAGHLPAHQWVGIELVIDMDQISIFVDGVERYNVKADFSHGNDPFSLEAHGGDVWVKSVTTTQQ